MASMGGERSTAARENTPDPDVGQARSRASTSDNAILDLQRTAGNAAVTRLLTHVQRIPGGGTAAEAAARSQTILAELEAIIQRASLNHDAITGGFKGTIACLKTTSSHLSVATENYKQAWTTFSGVMKEADEVAASDEKFRDVMQGLAIATVLGALGPEMLLLRKAADEAKALAKEAKTLLDKATEAFAGEVAEVAAGAGVDATRDSQMPSDTTGRAGLSAGELYEKGFKQLTEMIANVPEVGDDLTVQKNVLDYAHRLARGVENGEGGDDLERKVAQLKAAIAIGNRLATVATTTNIHMTALMTRALVIPQDSPEIIENRLWTNWIAYLQPGESGMLKNRAIYRHLRSKGLLAGKEVSVDVHNADGEAQVFIVDDTMTINDAKERWLAERGVAPGANVGETDTRFKAQHSRFRAQQALDKLRPKVVGRSGRIDMPTSGVGNAKYGGTWIDVDGVLLQLSYQSHAQYQGRYKNGDLVEILDIGIPRHNDGNETIIENWGDSRNFEAYVKLVTTR
jgi:hypothetical protein